MGKKIVIVEDQKEERLTIATTIGDEKKEEQLLMGSTKRKQQLFKMNKGRRSCCWGSIRLLRHILQVMQLKGPLM
jgi:hypothetical protein